MKSETQCPRIGIGIGIGVTKATELAASNKPTTIKRAPRTQPTTARSQHPPHKYKDDVPWHKEVWKKPCIKHAIYITTGAHTKAEILNDPTTYPKPDNNPDWELLVLYEYDENNNPINDHAFDEWYWIRCEARQGCCTKGVKRLDIRVKLAKTTSAQGAIYMNDFHCRCLEDPDS
jgi:hypothetical protein